MGESRQMSTNTDIETKLKELHDYLEAEIGRYESRLENIDNPDTEYHEGALDAFIDIEKRLYDKFLRELTHEHN